MSSDRWKELERTAGRKLGGRHALRWLDFYQSAPDVLVEDFHLVVVAKTHKRFSHHSRLDEMRRASKYATVPLDFQARLLEEARAGRGSV